MSYQDLPHQHDEHQNIALICEKLNQEAEFQILADIFKQLGDANRLRIFWLLCHCEECVSNISALIDMSSPAVCHHLRILKSNHLITGKRKGKEVLYKASNTEQSKLLHHIIEESMQITCPKLADPSSELPADQIALIRQIHDYLLKNITKKITIESLAQDFAINTTSLKKLFKSVYGTSLASHIKEHRMQLAEQLLRETTDPIASIARQVGFESQSRFSASFKEYYQVLPSKYREFPKPPSHPSCSPSSEASLPSEKPQQETE